MQITKNSSILWELEKGYMEGIYMSHSDVHLFLESTS